MKMIESGQYKFEPGAMSIIQMGEELIGHPSTAINELVKNGYDADADKCYVYTEHDANPDKNFLIIKDNGLGMDGHTLFGSWLRPSISSKRDDDREKRRSEIYERRYLGSKGIGRLASMALGRYLTVISRKAYEAKYNWLRIDRESFRVEDLLYEITFPGGQVDDYKALFIDEPLLKINNLVKNDKLIDVFSKYPFGDFKEGTIIVLQDLDDSVNTIIGNEVDTKEIKIDQTTFFKSLRDLITPLRLNKEIQDELVSENILDKALNIDNGSSTFELFYGSNFIKDQLGQDLGYVSIEPSSIVRYYDYRVFGKVTQSSEVTGRYICRRIDEDLINENFDLDANFLLSDETLQTRKTAEKEDLPARYKDGEVGEFYFDLRIYDLDDDAKDKMVAYLRASGRREATQSFSKYLGVKISKNGFGVKPYGEEERDWLGLGARRVNRHQISIGPNQIIGYTFLYSPQNDSLNEKTNREGFFENKAFIVFKKILTGILEETGRRRAKFRAKHNLGRRIQSTIDRPDPNKFIEYILRNYESNSEIVRLSREFVDGTNVALENLEESLTFSQRLASLGTGLELVYHELAQPLNSIGASTSSLITNIDKLQDEKLKSIFTRRVETITSSLSTLKTLQQSLQPAIGRSVPKVFKPIDTFKKVCYLFENILSSNDVRLKVDERMENLELKDIEYIFWISFLNIMNNAVYWLRFAQGEKIIYFVFKSEKSFSISNTGPTIPEDELDIIFDYGMTGRKEKNATGLGLAFTRSTLGTRDWSIVAENLDYGPNFVIEKIDIKRFGEI